MNLSRHALADPPNIPSLCARSGPHHRRVTYPAVQLLDVTGPVHVFACANDFVAGASGAEPPCAIWISLLWAWILDHFSLDFVAGGFEFVSSGLDFSASE